MSSDLRVVADLDRRLRELPEPPPRRRAPVAAAALAVLAAAAGALALATRDTPDAVAVERHADRTIIRVLDARADPARLTAELRRRGVDASVRTRPVKAEWVGTWVSVLVNARAADGRPVPLPGVRVEDDTVVVPTGAPVDIVLTLGVPGG